MSKAVILTHLSNGDVQSAKSLLTSWKPTSPDSIWDQNLAKVKTYLYDSDYISALALLETLIRICPEDLKLVSDKMLCLYHLGLQRELQTELDYFLKHCKTLDESNFGPTILISKLLEEIGQINQAKDLLEKLELKNLTLKQLQTKRIQLLRLNVELGNLEIVKNIYIQILQGKEHNQDFEIEREHALMLADALINGFDHAFERYLYLQSKKMVSADLHFLRSEIIEQIVLNNRFDLLKDINTNGDPQETYENQQLTLLKAYLQNDLNYKPSVIKLEKILSPISLLRFLRQYLVLFGNNNEIDLLYSRYNFHCNNLQSKYLKDKFNYTLEKLHLNQPVLIDQAQSKISVNDYTHTFSSTFFWNLIPLFKDGNLDAPFDLIISKIFREEMNSQHYNRLRIAISRINKDFNLKFNNGPLFRFSKERVTLLKKIRVVL